MTACQGTGQSAVHRRDPSAGTPHQLPARPQGPHPVLEKNSYHVMSSVIKGTVRPDWICMRVVSLESTLNGHQPLYVFNFLFLILNILQDFKVLSRSMQK
jgi:hypothetical protein